MDESLIKMLPAFNMWCMSITNSYSWVTHEHEQLLLLSNSWTWAGMVQWWEHSPPTSVARVRFPVSASYVGWVCCWLSSFLRGFFSGYSGFPPSTKTNISNSTCKQWREEPLRGFHWKIPIFSYSWAGLWLMSSYYSWVTHEHDQWLLITMSNSWAHWEDPLIPTYVTSNHHLIYSLNLD